MEFEIRRMQLTEHRVPHYTDIVTVCKQNSIHAVEECFQFFAVILVPGHRLEDLKDQKQVTARECQR